MQESGVTSATQSFNALRRARPALAGGETSLYPQSSQFADSTKTRAFNQSLAGLV